MEIVAFHARQLSILVEVVVWFVCYVCC